MKKQPMRATGLVAAGVIVGGILAATLGAQAADERGDAAQPAAAQFQGGPGGPRGFGGPGGGADLADALGVSEEKLQSAFEAIRDDLRPADGERPDGPPSAAERKAHRAKLAAALAKELGVSEDKVTAALEKVQMAHTAEHRDALSDRLDEAVKDGKLSSDDKAAVLKAFDAGVLGGPGPR